MAVANVSAAAIFVGNIVHYCREGLDAFSGSLVVERGRIISVGRTKNVEEIAQSLNLTKYVVSELKPCQFIMPGLVDCHLHAPQFPNLGLGLDRPLLEWLTAYTFPLEKQYDDITFATNVYDTVVNRTLKNGTTTACYFGSLHLESSVVLAAVAEDRGQRALVGKVSMDIPNDMDYFNKSEKEIDETENFIKLVRDMESDLVEPIITPRFALSCCESTMKKLGELAKKYNCKIQSHISENIGEINAVKEMFPECKTYAEVYDRAGLLMDKTIMAHAVHLEDSEIKLLAKRGVSIAHCPASNTRLMSGLCPVRKLIKNGLKVGLGTDVAGGDSTSILDAIRRCMDVSSHLCLMDGNSENSSVTWTEAFYLATLGGAKALSLDSKIGNFEVGKEFDALIIDPYCQNSTIDNYHCLEEVPSLSPESNEEKIKHLLQKFIYAGSDVNISKIFIKGREILF
ncbi:guanine deaminase [Arctopsyche grandis]|uniref:guanine deaminase n=1 Tax=Arctopsyche grandis TaxID=121162 RepID=UPI00406D7E54